MEIFCDEGEAYLARRWEAYLARRWKVSTRVGAVTLELEHT
jgi:hypothetical protein